MSSVMSRDKICVWNIAGRKARSSNTATCAVTHPRQAVCGKAARTDLGGGRAMKRRMAPLRHLAGCARPGDNSRGGLQGLVP